MDTLNTRGARLVSLLQYLDAHEQQKAAIAATQETVNIVGAGGMVTAAYEQLRNAAENTEEHLLLQHAIRRFFKQIFLTRDSDLIQKSGNELAVELTLAGYIPNNTLSFDQINSLQALAMQYYTTYEKLFEMRAYSSDRAEKWTLDVLAVQAEEIISDHVRETIFLEFAYDQYHSMFSQEVLLGREYKDYGQALYIAIHQALLKSDEAVVRAALLKRYAARVEDLEAYTLLNQQLDTLFEAPEVDTLRHAVDKHGAPLRIIRRMIDDRDGLSELLTRREAFLDEYGKTVESEYARIAKRVNRAIVRSVIFLIITKVIIGVAIEVPYDYWAHDGIIWLPLIINLLFPPLYMIALRATHALPGYANTTALVDRIDAMLYSDQPILTAQKMRTRRYSSVFYGIYAILSLVVFALVTWGLVLLEFSWVHILIFIVFISTASFLGFRLSRMIRELEVVKTRQNGITFIRDLVYLPFVVIGRWISDKYSKINVVTIILDMLIELPLKTVLRLIRQWSAFIDDRKDQL